MSGNVITRPIAVSNQTMPPGNLTATVPILVDLTTTTSIAVDLTNSQRTGIFNALQSVYVDNSGNLSSVSLQFSGSQQIVTCPPTYQGWVPVLSINPPVITVSSSGGVKVPLFFCNVPMPVGFWPTVAGGATPPLTLTSRSIASTAAGASTQLMAANTSRRYFGISPQSGATVWINPLGGVAAANGPDCFPLTNGQLYEPPPEGVTASAINYFDAAGGNVLNAWEG